MTDTDPDQALREWKRKIFDDSTAPIPRVFLNVARRHIHLNAHAIGYTNPEHGIHTVSWLNGSQFGVLSCEGSNDDSNAAITGFVIPLAELKHIDIAIEDQRYDEVTRRVTQWTRRATFTFSGKKGFTLHSVETPDRRPGKTGDFIDRVLLALASYGQPG